MSKIDINSLPVVDESPLQPTNIQFPERVFGNHILGYSTISPKMCASVTLVSRH